ncbi:Multicopper oxidase [hydrothermal vent metagenome]|uniref:Multicopper oxidase n=1 Tax=hydrothermal vent metagenome TaxID=652676 RepID=A0A1W1D1I4_9ZZZZ
MKIASILYFLILLSSSLFSTTFDKQLPIPPLAPYTLVNNEKVFDMHIRASTHEFYTGIASNTYGINASVLGQTIRIRKGDKVKIKWNNHLNEATTMHGHGMHVPAMMDGGPKNKILPNTTWTINYSVNQEASTNWYHPHLMGKTAEHVYMGLAGLILIDEESENLNLPKTYGVDDIPLILQDKRFDSNKQIDYSPTTREIRRGYTSDIMLVNAVINPYVNVASKKVRFRLLNGSNGRVYHLAFSDNRFFHQIATDGGFLEAAVRLNTLTLSPGERAEIIVDFSNDFLSSIILKDTLDNLDILQIHIDKNVSVTEPLPSTLTTLNRYNISDSVKVRTFVLNMIGGHMAINSKTMDINRIDEVVPVNDVEIWDITNSMGMEHNFHIHATHFWIIERDGSVNNVPQNEQGYKDVVRIPPNSSVRIILKMTDFIDGDNGYMYHCHFLEHEDDGMMGQFTVVQNTRNPVADFDGDGLDNTTDLDDDNDAVLDIDDAFPFDASESIDTDGDGIGNNKDSDDDNDLFSDAEELIAGTNPLDKNSHPAYTWSPISMGDGIVIFVPTRK